MSKERNVLGDLASPLGRSEVGADPSQPASAGPPKKKPIPPANIVYREGHLLREYKKSKKRR